MTVGVLLITHERIGEALLDIATTVYGQAPLAAGVFGVARDADTEQCFARALSAARAVESGDGVLLLCDLYGSTPCNVAVRVRDTLAGQLVSGVNLPMLLRIFNYPQLPLRELALKAADGGRAGVLS